MEIFTQKKNLKYLISTILIIFLISFGIYSLFLINYSNDTDSLEVSSEIHNKTNKFKSLNLEAKSVFILRMKTGEELFSINGEQQLPLASLSKIMTALVASENYKNLDVITIGEKSLRHDGNNGLQEGEKWRLKDLLDFTLVVSSNDGASAVASALEGFKKNVQEKENFSFVDEMNSRAKKIGLMQTYFLNESGLDIDEEYQGGAFGSAKDMAMLMDYVVKNNPNILEATSYDVLSIKSEDGILHRAENTNELINQIPWLIGSKTGYTDLAGGNLAVVFDKGLMDPIIVVVLGSTQEGRFTDVQRLINVIMEI